MWVQFAARMHGRARKVRLPATGGWLLIEDTMDVATLLKDCDCPSVCLSTLVRLKEEMLLDPYYLIFKKLLKKTINSPLKYAHVMCSCARVWS